MGRHCQSSIMARHSCNSTEEINNQEGAKKSVGESLETNKNSKGNSNHIPKETRKTRNHNPGNQKIKTEENSEEEKDIPSKKLKIANEESDEGKQNEESDEGKQTTPENSNVGEETKSYGKTVEEDMKHLDEYSNRYKEREWFQKCYAMMLNYRSDVERWNEEKSHLLSQINGEKKILDQVNDLKDANFSLASQLADALISLDYYKSINNKFTEAQRQWDEEKRIMTEKINEMNECCNSYLQKIAVHEKSIDRLEEEKDKLIAELIEEKSTSDYFKTCLKESEEQYYNLSYENKVVVEKMLTEAQSAAELECKVVKLEAKCVELEEERDGLAAQIAAAKASVGCLNDLDS